jgi:hypothetical protein
MRAMQYFVTLLQITYKAAASSKIAEKQALND